jgi:hypothetical protein
MNYKKYIKSPKLINPYSGYSPSKAQKREMMALTLLNSYCQKYPCSCGPHFPKLINYKKNKYITLSNQGIDIKQLKHTTHIIEISNLEQQTRCIYDTLNNCQLSHLDLNNNGKNVCVSRNGIISLIDFDIMHFMKIDNINTLTPLMIQRIKLFDYCTSYEKFHDKIYKIISLCRNIIILSTNKIYIN